MMYNDGFPMDDDLRVTECPKCKNEEFSPEADFCRICGTSLYNLCDGEDIYDYNGNYQDTERHRNHGNARFCEKCGKPTMFLNKKFLRPFDEVQNSYINQYLESNPNAMANNQIKDIDDDYDLPF